MITEFKLFENIIEKIKSEKDYESFYLWFKDNNISNPAKIDFVKNYINNGSDINAANSSGISILMVLIHFGRKNEIKLLIDSGADVNWKTNWGDTPLIWVGSYFNMFDESEIILKYLLDAGAKITVSDEGRDLFSNDNGRILEIIKNNYPEIYSDIIKKKRIKKFKI